MKKTTMTISGILFILFVTIFIWPTLFRYEKATDSGNTYPVRINRITGKAQWYSVLSGWIDPTETSNNLESQVIKELPSEELKKIEGTESFILKGKKYFGIHNGSSWTVSEMIFSIKNKGTNGIVKWDRNYKASLSPCLLPLTDGFTIFEIIDLYDTDELEWSIKSAVGTQSKK